MLKINFNTPFPHSQRDVFIHSFRDMGFKYERIIQNGDFSLFRFYGKIPCEDFRKTNVDIIFGDDVDIDKISSSLVRSIEIYCMFERS